MSDVDFNPKTKIAVAAGVAASAQKAMLQAICSVCDDMKRHSGVIFLSGKKKKK